MDYMKNIYLFVTVAHPTYLYTSHILHVNSENTKCIYMNYLLCETETAIANLT